MTLAAKDDRACPERTTLEEENVDAAHVLTRNDSRHIVMEALVPLLLRTKDWTGLERT
jgi:hypothetical protein